MLHFTSCQQLRDIGVDVLDFTSCQQLRNMGVDVLDFNVLSTGSFKDEFKEG